mmetsp:Transcript_19562/g.48790  ORF Transcript_19562/g.48790 Transcript_19562/m.48790 type:complete len:80 (-) Transcript_19562:610-849(-)
MRFAHLELTTVTCHSPPLLIVCTGAGDDEVRAGEMAVIVGNVALGVDDPLAQDEVKFSASDGSVERDVFDGLCERVGGI